MFALADSIIRIAAAKTIMKQDIEFILVKLLLVTLVAVLVAFTVGYYVGAKEAAETVLQAAR